MKSFIKSKWFLISLFVMLELIAFTIGSFFRPFCTTIGNCPSMELPFLILGIIPNGIIILIVRSLIKKYYKG
ncbi:MAG: hypothetical protein V1659_05685 [Candidatus Woesearchaeota archaeon]